MNPNKVIIYLIGLIFVIAGTAIALEMFYISFSSVVLLLIGIGFLVAHKKTRNNVFKYLSCFFVPTGIAYFIISAFNVSDSCNFMLIYSSLACAFLCLYLCAKQKIFLYISVAIVMFALHVYTNAQPDMSKLLFGYDCFYIAVISVIVFAFEYKSIGYFPLGVSVVTYLAGVLNFLNGYNIISPNVYKLSISLTFVIIGAFILCNNYFKSINDKKENLHEQAN